MPRKYSRKPGSRRYADYSLDVLHKCLAEVKNGVLSTRAAERHFGIPRRTIINKLKGHHSLKPGKPNIFTDEEEEAFADCVVTMSEFGFPVDEWDLRSVIASYLQRTGREVKVFVNNVPGKEWITSFLKRKPELTMRFAANIKRARAAITENILTDYIDNLKKVLESVPPENVWNYDETNLTDDPGAKRIITKRGVKYPEKIRNASKASISVMVSGSAAGELLPPYVVYRSQHLWSTWQEGGPKNTRYNNSKSGWFTAEIFTDWFQSMMLPKLKKLQGKKVLIGDNLSSHLTDVVLTLCKENDIYFVCLPPNSTHLTQPLDVAFFRPLKVASRKILGRYRDSEAGIRSAVLQKQHFPHLLKELMDEISANAAENLKSGFRKCDILPCDVSELLQHLPRRHDKNDVENSFRDFLAEKRHSITTCGNTLNKRRKINVPAGKSVAHESGPTETADSVSCNSDSVGKGRGLRKGTFNNEITEDPTTPTISECNSEDNSQQSLGRSTDFELHRDGICGSLLPLKKICGEFVIFTYENELFAGKIIKCCSEEVVISSMQRSKKAWKWPVTPDILSYDWEDILGSIKPPKKLSNRGYFSVPELNEIWV